MVDESEVVFIKVLTQRCKCTTNWHFGDEGVIEADENLPMYDPESIQRVEFSQWCSVTQMLSLQACSIFGEAEGQSQNHADDGPERDCFSYAPS
jgi:hypothetical protein